jgi:hypothetical protein
LKEKNAFEVWEFMLEMGQIVVTGLMMMEAEFWSR